MRRLIIRSIVVLTMVLGISGCGGETPPSSDPHPPTLTNFSGAIAENATAGTSVGTLTVSDPGDSPITAITLSGTGAGNFTVDPAGAITVASGAVLDFETLREYNLTAVATNGAGESTPVAVNIAVTDIPDIKPVLADSSGTVAENSPADTVVGQIAIASSGDRPIIAITLQGPGEGNFTVSLDGNITVQAGASIDYEALPIYNLTAVATNDAGESASVNVTISVTDVPDVVPVLADSTGTVAENAPAGTVVGAVTITDSGDSSITAMTLSGMGADNFKVATDGTLTVQSGAALDYENTPIYNLTAVATNDAGESTPVAVNIAVTDVPDIPPTLTDSTGTVAENSPAGTAVGQIAIASSGDRPITAITLQGSGEGNFTVSLDGNITVQAGASIDYETLPIYNLTAVATNDAGDSAPIAVTISVTDVPDVVPVLAAFSETVEGNATAGTPIGSITVIHPGDSTITGYTLSDTTLFEIDTHGMITTGNILDDAISSQYVMSVYATNAAGNSTPVDVTITIIPSPQDILTASNDTVVQTVGDNLQYNVTGGSGSGSLVFGGVAFVAQDGTLTATGTGTVQVYRDGRYNYTPSNTVEFNLTAISRPSFDLDGNQSDLTVGSAFDLDSHVRTLVDHVIVDDDAVYPLTYRYELIGVPYGSALTKTITDGTFTPDVEGRYIVSVELDDGISGHTRSEKSYIYLDTTGYVPYNSIDVYPVANGGEDLIEANLSQEVVLDGSHSAVTKGTIAYDWHFIYKPAASSAVLSDTDTPKARLTPDVDGVYIVELNVSDGTDFSTDIIQVYTTGDMTDVTGAIDIDTNWTLENSPYNLTANVDISAVLTIEPGVVVLANNYWLRLNTSSAKLFTTGSESMPVYIDKTHIAVKEGSTSELTLEHLVLKDSALCLIGGGISGYRDCQGGLTMKDSLIIGSLTNQTGGYVSSYDYMYIWYPNRALSLHRNLWINYKYGFRAGATNGLEVENNLFYKFGGDKEFTIWNANSYTIKNNTMVETSFISLYATYYTPYNYWEKRDISTLSSPNLPVITNESIQVPDHRKYTPYDADRDGVDDKIDNCPSTPNPGQEDSDDNKIGDACEP